MEILEQTYTVKTNPWFTYERKTGEERNLRI